MQFIPPLEIGIWNAWLFMGVFVLQMIAMFLADKRIREKSHVPDDARRKRSEKYAGIIGNIIWFLAMGLSLFLPLLIGTPWFYTGLFFFLIGLILIVAATFSFMTTSADQAITKGVYRLSRHPMYLATFFICLGSGTASGSGLFVLLVIIMAWCFHKEALVEERYCLENYGFSYQQYMERVPRWIGIARSNYPGLI
jgi:protein-S-isoprenylcysteine O-methyltransferase Ste14